MPLKPVTDMMRDALDGGYAVGYFESWNLESLQGVIDAAEETRSPMIIGFNGDFLSRQERLAQERISWYAALGRAAAESATVPCALIFNECPRDEWVCNAVDAGFTLVMPDPEGVAQPEAVRRIRGIVEYAHARGVAVEAETGHLPWGASGEVDETERVSTDPEAAARFVEDTGVDLLAVSVGNVHVLLDGERGLDLDRLAAIREKVAIPLDLHGGTGIQADDLREAISLGVAKVCYGTYLKQFYLAAVRSAVDTEETNPHRLLGYGEKEDVMTAGRLAVRDGVLERIDLLGCCGKG
ncbi:MAG: class II fructose-bisphosphate aldolase [Lentisphaerae bacterium]|nr:class II fructose-bisphosphate aldolase [Lentisphaerota bacterium]